MNSMLKALFILLVFPIIANATVYYVANSPCSGNSGWSNGSNSNNGLSKAAPFLTIVYALQQMKDDNGDTLIIDDGTYTGSVNMIGTSTEQIPYGTSGNYTTVKAENTGEVVIDVQYL